VAVSFVDYYRLSFLSMIDVLV